MGNAYVESGAVIISDDGKTVRYHRRCNFCLNVDMGTTGSVYVCSGTRCNVTTYTCPKCGKTTWVKINRDC